MTDHPVDPSDPSAAGSAVPPPWGDSGLDPDDLRDSVADLSGRMSAAMCEWLGLVAEVDRREAWSGFASCAAWLSWRCGIGAGTAGEHLRVARTLGDLPLIREQFAAGSLSYSQVRALTRAAGLVPEATLLDVARYATGNQLERLIRALRRSASPQEEAIAEDRSEVGWHVDDDGTLFVRARLAGEAAATVLAALEQVATADPAAPLTRAEAFVEMARRSLTERSTTTGARVALIADLDALEDAVTLRQFDPLSAESPAPSGQTPDGPGTEPEIRWEPTGVPASVVTLATLLDDRQVDLIARLADGSLVDVGRARRRPSARLARAVRRRFGDRCGVPTCWARRYLHLHHVQHWAAGGPTSLDNLVPLCSRHHRELHEGLLSIQVDDLATGLHRFTFLDRYGVVIAPLAKVPTSKPGRWEPRDLSAAGAAGLAMIRVEGRALPMDLHSTAAYLVRSA